MLLKITNKQKPTVAERKVVCHYDLQNYCVLWGDITKSLLNINTTKAFLSIILFYLCSGYSITENNVYNTPNFIFPLSLKDNRNWEAASQLIQLSILLLPTQKGKTGKFLCCFKQDTKLCHLVQWQHQNTKCRLHPPKV